MLGKLARWLRILGYDSLYAKEWSDSNLLLAAKRESLILLTSDTQLYRTAISRGVECFLVHGENDSEKLAYLADRFDLRLELDPMTSRCPICGFPIKPVTKEKIADSIPPTTFKAYQSFWICTNNSCAKIYWQGSHSKKIEEKLRNASEILDRKRRERTEKWRVPLTRGRPDIGMSGTSGHNQLPKG